MAAKRLRRSEQAQAETKKKAAAEGTAPALRPWIRFKDIRDAGIAASWRQLANLIRDAGFPTGKMIGPNTRAWPLEEVEAWLAARPIKHECCHLHESARERPVAATQEPQEPTATAI
jgi:predicted DNA-binding transcriptional regulator AlpA